MKVILAEVNWANNGAGFYVKESTKKLINLKATKSKTSNAVCIVFPISNFII